MRKIISCVFLFLLFFLFPKPIFADENTDFSFATDGLYEVSESGKTKVTLTGFLTNKTSGFYASSYFLTLGYSDIQNIEAFDPGGKITPKIEKLADGQRVHLKFKSPVVGLGNTLKFTLVFETKNIASKKGNIWEIFIPGIGEQKDFTRYNVLVIVPQSFGKAAIIKPNVEQKSNTVFAFTKNDLKNSGVSILFGETQIYEFDLTYRLKNIGLIPSKKEIALPPKTNYQNVYIQSIDPKPQNVVEDADANWLASFLLLPSEQKEIKVKGFVEVSHIPSKQALSSEQKTVYLKEQPYWELSQNEIQKIAKELQTPKRIYQYVVTHLTYDFSRVTENKGRVGASNVLKNPTSAVCLEFTDLFIALSRAAGIPARENDGFAFTQNTKQRPLSLVKDILHAWPEYYDEKKETWVMVDPTWGNTTNGIDYFYNFDFDHVVFVKRGKKSDYPIPAGGYKVKGMEYSKDIQMKFTTQPINANEHAIEITTEIPKEFSTGISSSIEVTIKNNGPQLLTDQKILVRATRITPKTQEILYKNIPPHGSVTTKVFFDAPSFLTNENVTITITVGENTISKSVIITPFFIFYQKYIIGGIICAILTFILFIITGKTRSLPVSRRRK